MELSQILENGCQVTEFRNELMFLEKEEKVTKETLVDIGFRFGHLSLKSEREIRWFIAFVRTGYIKPANFDPETEGEV